MASSNKSNILIWQLSVIVIVHLIQKGGASRVTTVDLSNTYLNWAKENFRINNFNSDEHDFIKTDVKEWIKNDAEDLYDLVILDPPTVSRSKMAKSKFDIQPDHPELIHHVLKI